jgi:hypothetical protein
LVGFGYQFNALSQDSNQKNEFSEALSTLFNNQGIKPSLINLLRGAFPVLRLVVLVSALIGVCPSSQRLMTRK